MGVCDLFEMWIDLGERWTQTEKAAIGRMSGLA